MLLDIKLKNYIKFRRIVTKTNLETCQNTLHLQCYNIWSLSRLILCRTYFRETASEHIFQGNIFVYWKAITLYLKSEFKYFFFVAFLNACNSVWLFSRTIFNKVRQFGSNLYSFRILSTVTALCLLLNDPILKLQM